MKNLRFYTIGIFIVVLLSAIIYKTQAYYGLLSLGSADHNIEEDFDSLNAKNKDSHFFPVSSETVHNNELQRYTSERVQIDGNHVKLTASFKNNEYLSGKVESNEAIKYGTFSFRIKTIQKKGLFPAIWLLPNKGGVYPELDLYEMVGQLPNEMHGVIHLTSDINPSKNKVAYSFIHNLNSNQIDNSYVLAFEWTPEKISWYIDNVLVGETDNCIDEPMYMIINLAIGGDWPGDPNKEELPETFDVEVLDFSPQEVFPRE